MRSVFGSSNVSVWLMIAVVCVYVGWVRSMCGEVYIAGVPGEVGNRDTFSAVIICIMDLKKNKKILYVCLLSSI